jgi:hypothetical protein
MPKVAVIVTTLVSFAWIVLLYASRSANGPRAALVLAIPVALSLWGLSSAKRRKMAGASILLFSLVIFLVSFWIIALSYLPSAILLLASKRAEAFTPALSPNDLINH